MVRLIISIPENIKARLDALRSHGTTASGFIRALLQREFNSPKAAKKGR